MKKYRFIIPIASVALTVIIFITSFCSLYAKANDFRVTFLNRDGLFSGINIKLEVYDQSDKYSIITPLKAGGTAYGDFTYGDKYGYHYGADYNSYYFRGESEIMLGYSFEIPQGDSKIEAEGGDTHQFSVQYPDGRVETQTYREPYYKVERVYISHRLWQKEGLVNDLLFESEPILLEAKDGIEIFAGGDSYFPEYIELKTQNGTKTRIITSPHSNTFWTDSAGNIWFLDCLESTYFKESAIHHFKNTEHGGKHNKIADISFENDRRILDYRVYENTSLIVSEDKAGTRYISTCDHRTGELHEICSFFEEANDEIVIEYSNGVACIRFAKTLYFSHTNGTRSTYTSDIYYLAVDMASHKLCASGKIMGHKTDDIISNNLYQKQPLIDVLWQNGRLYVIDIANARTVSPVDISNIPIISVMDKDGEILMGYRFLSAAYPENGGQDVIVSFCKEE